MVRIGAYPEIALADACKRRDRARSLFREGRDPSEERAAKKDSAKRDFEALFPAVTQAWGEYKRT